MFTRGSFKIVCLTLATLAAVTTSSFAHLCSSRERGREQEPNPCRCNNVEHFVCGSDGRTYQNMCWFLCKSLSDPDLTIKEIGKCEKSFARWPSAYRSGRRGAAAVATDEDVHSMDLDSLLSLLDSVSSMAEPPRKKPVAELDLILEGPNSTESKGINVPIQFIGLPCSRYLVEDGGCSADRCQKEEVDPVCSTAGITYRNNCDFCCAYLNNPDFKIWYKGECETTTATARAENSTASQSSKKDTN